MTIEPIAYFHSPVSGKFGLPRQAGIVNKLKGSIQLNSAYAREEALRGLEGFDIIWLIWGFNLNENKSTSLTVRPPRLGGNERVGVFASRSPFRPNSLGLSSVHIEKIEPARGIIHVSGADLADGTPIYDIKPYVSYSDAHPDAKCGFVDQKHWTELEVEFNHDLELNQDDLEALKGILAQDPRPQYHNDSSKVYALSFKGLDVKFQVKEGKVIVL